MAVDFYKHWKEPPPARSNTRHTTSAAKAEPPEGAVEVPIPEFEGQIYATPDGHIFSRRYGKILSESIHSKYLAVSINGRQWNVHRLIATAFVPNPDPEKYTIVDHIDENKEHNYPENLRWCTKAQNTQFAYDSGTHTKTSSKKVRRSDGAVFNTLTEAAQSVDVTTASISRCIHGKTQTAGGYGWTEVIDE